LDSLFEIQKVQKGESVFAETRELFHSFQQLPKRIRGPFLGEIDLETRLLVVGMLILISSPLLTAFDSWGNKRQTSLWIS
jgi:hypothetical protein